jgi:hypothetical protein
MNRIIRTALASVGAAVVITGGSLGVAYATAPSSPPASASTGDTDQVGALNQSADDLLTKIAALEKQLASTPAPASSSSTLTKEEVAVPAVQAAAPTTRVATTTVRAPAAAAPATATKTYESDSKNSDSKNGDDSND